MKFLLILMKYNLQICRSREGAWIEIDAIEVSAKQYGVAPARERGLKFISLNSKVHNNGRSREGAWIEIPD